MKPQMLKIRPLLLIASLALPGLATAQSFPCGSGGQFACDAPSAPRVEQKTQSGITAKDDAMTFVLKSMNLQGIRLTEEQRVAILNILQSQAPEIMDHMAAIESAHGFLREMAVSKRYDDTLANALVQAIAENSANLALLQAAREYQVFALLTPEQVKQVTNAKS